MERPPFAMYYMGCEQVGWRNVLAENGVTTGGVSYWSLRRRMPRRGVDFSDWPVERVLLDSGGYTANKKPEEHTVDGWRQYGEEYAAFATAHADELDLIVEFDCIALGSAWISEQRRTVWSQVDPMKFVPVWHPEYGISELEAMAANYRRIAVAQDAVEGKVDISPQLNVLARSGTLIHGLAMTKPELMKRVPFATAASTSWLSPMQYGDTIVWDNNRLVRYPKKLKKQARERHAAQFRDQGFDPEAIQDDDATEVTKLTIFAWQSWVADVQVHQGGSYNDSLSPEGVDGEMSLQPVGTDAVDAGKTVATRAPVPVVARGSDEIKLLPTLGPRHIQLDEGDPTSIIHEAIEVRGQSMRRCDSCVIRDKCPDFKQHSTCAYSIPVQVRTPSDRKALIEGMLEMQNHRVHFGYMVEQANGGYPDANLSAEFDRLRKMIETQAELMDDRDFLEVSIKQRGGGGRLSQLFGAAPPKAAPKPVRQLDPSDTDFIIEGLMEGQKVTQER